MGSQIRQHQLIDILKNKPTLRVSDLAEQFNVSESTIRRDLSKLENIGMVKRVHGGALTEDSIVSEPPFEVRKITHQKEKAKVGEAAASLVKDDYTIFIDGGTTTPFIVPHLDKIRNLTVVTVGLNVAYQLASLPSINTIQIGGELDLNTWVYAGPLSIQALTNCGLSFDLAFISAVGVSTEYGVTNQIINRIHQKQRAIELSRKVAVVVDGSKIGKVSTASIIPLHSVDLLVTNKSAPEEEIAQIQKLGIDVILAEND